MIQLGHCFDLLDTGYTRQIAIIAEELKETLRQQGRTLPQNQKAAGEDYDWLKRDRDCFVLNWGLPVLGDRLGRAFQTVRGVFQEGPPAFPGAGIKLKSHIQITVRDPSCIIGYFRPEAL